MPTLSDHGTKGTAMLLAVAGALMSFFPGLMIGPFMKILGFSKSGIVAGSLAAKIHSFMGIITSPGIFAWLQSAGMGGYGAPILAGIVKAVGLSTAALGAVLAGSSKLKP